ncbi:hypothetical protein BJY01DRAFT_242079 [Aspergillus pseudoustus]|uniref:Uncharacterized protein n=1 Tax=Aspergillus pseudoustus TaxID=1810923 RepID=A0ABR4L3I1_9EURO
MATVSEQLFLYRETLCWKGPSHFPLLFLSKQTEDLEAARDEVSEVRNELAEEESRCLAAETSNAILCDRIYVLRQILRWAESERDMARSKAERSDGETDANSRDFDAKIMELKEKLHGKTAECDRVVESMKELDASAERIRKRVRELQCQLDERTEECNEAKESNNQSGSIIRNLQDQVLRLEEQQRESTRISENEVDSRVKRLQNKVAELKGQLGVKTKESEEARQAKRAVDAKVAELEKELEECAWNLDKEVTKEVDKEMNTRFRYLNDQVAQLSQQLSQKTLGLEFGANTNAKLPERGCHPQQRAGRVRHPFQERPKCENQGRIAELEQQLIEQANNADSTLQQEIERLQSELQNHKDQLVGMSTLVADAAIHDEQLSEQISKMEDEIKGLLDEKPDLISENNQVTLDSETWKRAYIEATERVEAALRDNTKLEDEFMEASLENDNTIKQIQVTERKVQSGLRQTIQDARLAYDAAIAQERSNVNEAHDYAKKLEEENKDLKTRVALAMRDLQRSDERDSEAKETIRALKQQLVGQQ